MKSQKGGVEVKHVSTEKLKRMGMEKESRQVYTKRRVRTGGGTRLPRGMVL